MPTLNQKHSKQFHRYVAKWLEKFRLADWEVHYKFCDNESSNMADCVSEVDIKKALVTLYREWDLEPDKNTLNQTALHEVCHILLAPLMELAIGRYVTEKQLFDAEHDVIRALERMIFG